MSLFTPVPVSKATFVRLDSIITSFVWVGKIPRLARTLQLTLSQGRFAPHPNLQLYYWAGVLVLVHWWFNDSTQNPATTLEVLLGSYAALTNLICRGPKAHLRVTGPMCTMLRVWVQVRGIYKTEGTFSPHNPLWGYPHLRHLTPIPEPQLRAAKGIVTLKHVIKEGVNFFLYCIEGWICSAYKYVLLIFSVTTRTWYSVSGTYYFR